MMTANQHLTGPFAGTGDQVVRVLWGAASIVSMGASAYHGARRHNGSVGWGIWWGLMGGLFPVLTPAVGAAQGFAKCKFHCRS